MDFKIAAISTWLDKNKPSEINLIDFGKEDGSYPKIEKPFFRDLITNCQTFEKYRIEGGLLGVFGPNGQSFVADDFIFLWAVDFKDRFFQFLINRSAQEGGKGIIAAAAPLELIGFLKNTNDSLVATLSLINDPEKMKGVMLLVTQPPSYKEKMETEQKMQTISRFKNWVDTLKMTPNKEGQWFPTFKPRCPICNKEMTELEGFNLVFTQLICPDCGFKMKKGK